MKRFMILLLTAAACDSGKPSLAPPTGDLGTGLNTVERKYPRPVPDAHKAAVAALQAIELRIESEKVDALGGEIVARRITSDKVVATLKSVDAAMTSVSVRVGPGDRNMANLIQEKIALSLGLGDFAAGGESFRELYSADLTACTAAAEKAFKAVRMEIVGRANGEDWLEIRARGEDAMPAMFRLKKEGGGKTEVTLWCGIAKGPEIHQRCEQLKSEFEKGLPSGRSS